MEKNNMDMDEHIINIKEELPIALECVKLEEKSETIDVPEQHPDENEFHEREEYIIKNEESTSNCLVTRINANQLSNSFIEKMPEVLNPLMNNSEPSHLEQSMGHGSYVEGIDIEGNEKVPEKSVNMKIKEHKCSFCDHIATRNTHLRSHMESVHLNIRKHKCHLCEYATNDKHKLDMHIKCVHLKIKEHMCHLCDYVASKKRHLEEHVKCVHLNIKAHKCSLCEYETGRKQDLQKHVKFVHLKIKEHKCNLCKFATGRKNYLEQHINSVHLKIKEHKCHLCEYVTSKKQYLNVHVKFVHLKFERNRKNNTNENHVLKTEV